jgi:arginyl-tRNA synthetase
MITPGPGFINIVIKKEAIVNWITDIRKNGVKPPPQGGVREPKPLNIAVDFSSPNIAKEMHVGHLRSTIIGETLCRMFEFCGHSVKRINHVGDWGTQFGMLICNLEDSYPDFVDNQPNITDLTKFYKEAKLRFDKEEGFKLRAQKRVVELQAGEKKATEIWKLLCDISRLAFDQVYQRLGVKLEEFGESYYNSQIPGVISELEEKGLTKLEAGATCVWVEGRRVPLIVRKGDGGYGYDSTDIAAIKYRLQTLKSDWIVYITDDGQSSHFDLVFEGAKLAGWYTEKTRVEHIGFGVVQGEDGKRFRTRSGETVRLVDLLDEAKDRAIETLTGRVKEGRSDLKPDDIQKTGEALGYGCVKYFDLRQNPGTNYKFSYDKMLDPQGDTAVQLIYAFARGHSVLRKAEKDHGAVVSDLTYSGTWAHESEMALAFELIDFQDVIIQVLKDLSPNGLCNYLRVIVGFFTAFYTNCPVMKVPIASVHHFDFKS